MDYVKLCKDAYNERIPEFIYVNEKKTDTQLHIKQINEKLIIVFRGTTSVKDWRYDLEILRSSVDFLENTFVHSGFLRQYKSVRSVIHSQINKKVKKVICCGHSLGSALATICALDIKLRYPDINVGYLGCGGPRVGGPRFVKLFNSKIDASYRFVANKDPITFTPLPLRFRHVKGGKQFNDNELDIKTPPVYCFCGCRVSDHNMDTYLRVLKDYPIYL